MPIVICFRKTPCNCASMSDQAAIPDVFTTIRVQEVSCSRFTERYRLQFRLPLTVTCAVQTLEKNYEYIKKIAECQKNGKIAEATALTTKLHQNLTALARAADAQLPADLNQVCHILLF